MLNNFKKIAAIACVTVAVGAASLPSLVSAQTSMPNRMENRKPRGEGAWKNLNLTEAQKTQMKSIRESAKTRREAVLTAEQRAVIAQARQSGDRKGVKNSLNLTEAQKQQMKAIMQDTKTQIENVLTPEQKQQIAKFREERGSRRGGM
ncbi:MAG: hypothetical protein DCE90_02125 [Pseudanabaena sp.]|nr:MAG: hypothetical protein DCE90_02125 [Pseudanabaena sp.]